MNATPLIPGLLYAVKHNGQVHCISAKNAADAIAKLMGQLA